MKIFMDHPGEVLERENLFRQIWNTEYTEDTRTLDVHISWLRHAIEENPHKPRFLKTIRGVGYRSGRVNKESKPGALQLLQVQSFPENFFRVSR